MATIAKKRITTNTRVIKDILTKYKDTFHAFMELINNSLQAKATQISIKVNYPKDGEIAASSVLSMEILDNGHGVPYSEFDKTLLEIGTTVKQQGQGIGRFSALQIGEKMEICTVAYDAAVKQYSQTSFEINSSILVDSQLEQVDFDVPYEYIAQTNPYYKVTISQLHCNSQKNILKKNKLTDDFLPDKIRQAIFENYPFQIFNKNVKFIVNGDEIKREEFVIGEPRRKTIQYIDSNGKEHEMNFHFYNVKLSQYKVKVFLQLENAGIKTVAHEYTYSSDWYTPDLGTWLIYVDSSLFDSDLFRNLDVESLGDKEVTNLKNTIKEVINDFFKATNKRFEKFVNELEKDNSYPYRRYTPSSSSQETIFKKAAYLLEDEHGLIKKDNKIRDLLYPLLDKAISNGDVEYIFQEIAKLSDDTMTKFRSLLDQVDLEDVIHFASSVADKMKFLEFLHELTYGDISKVLLERKQLHKIIEKNLWVFGENYTFTPALWSDKKIGNILEEIRKGYFNYDLSAADDNLIEIDNFEGLDDITDLFFFNDKKTDNGVREIMVVELKSPKCAISIKEIEQINRYAYTLETKSGLPTDKVKYKLILISSKLTGYAKSQMNSKGKVYSTPFLFDKKADRDIEVYIIEWAELIEHNKRLLGYLSEQLNIKDASAKAIFEKEYPELITEKLSSQLKKIH